jgi:hypothetical protein
MRHMRDHSVDMSVFRMQDDRQYYIICMFYVLLPCMLTDQKDMPASYKRAVSASSTLGSPIAAPRSRCLSHHPIAAAPPLDEPVNMHAHAAGARSRCRAPYPSSLRLRSPVVQLRHSLKTSCSRLGLDRVAALSNWYYVLYPTT